MENIAPVTTTEEYTFEESSIPRDVIQGDKIGTYISGSGGKNDTRKEAIVLLRVIWINGGELRLAPVASQKVLEGPWKMLMIVVYWGTRMPVSILYATLVFVLVLCNYYNNIVWNFSCMDMKNAVSR